ncbi:PREDICTED: uncharacterized protein LOC105963521 [Erythranthe guttata]|uniref:uncharacterized protein LOC105963521 n=1 Tax=Erythranthe guttata TaxID=4155 RepID=UPI00064D97B0|nr:PREDICTED: uncharacterized protein LOC105963521 [Erythranthe guttata]|eukprot:XP_012843381.1 PREDICTED: uncharacterized protein LOC105963521 [Erythranthe guttata]
MCGTVAGRKFAEDISYRLQQHRTNSGPPVSDDTLRKYALIEIENKLQSNSKSLSNFPPMPIPIGSMTDATTFIWKTLSAAIRLKGEIVINVASSGIAPLLLPGGRTAHSRFVLPIIVHESSTCSIKQHSPHAELLSKAKLITWGKAPMMHRYCLEALDKTMKSILDLDMPFGGKVVVLGGDFRQIPPVVWNASRQEIVHATINSSPLWRQCNVMKLNKNMRLQSSSSSANVDAITKFADWILRMGNGDAGEVDDGDATIEIPDDMLIRDSADPFFGSYRVCLSRSSTNLFTPEYLEGRAIVAPTNESIGFVNHHFLSIITGEEKVFFSSDSMSKEELLSDINAEIYFPKFLNTISCSGIPPHKLTLKRGVPVMLIRNIDEVKGLCNGTRLQVINMGKHVLNCRILFGKYVGDMVFIPRMSLVPSNSALPIKFQQR